MIKKIRMALIGSGLSLMGAGVIATLTSSATVATPQALAVAVPGLLLAQDRAPNPESPAGVEPTQGREPSGGATRGRPLPVEEDAVPVPVADPTPERPSQPQPDVGQRGIHIATPDADVRVDASRGTVRVRAPYTAVDVDAEGGRVRVNAPRFSLDWRW